MSNNGRYPVELRERAVRMVLEHEREHRSRWEEVCSVANKLGPSAESVPKWVRRANEILKAASAFFGAELDRQYRR